MPIYYVSGKGWKITNVEGYSSSKKAAERRLSAIKIEQKERRERYGKRRK